MLSSNTSAVSGDTTYVEDVFSTYLYTGTGANQTITNNIDLATKGGLTWIKGRSAAGYSNNIFDTARGTNKRLFTNGTNAESTETGAVTAFNTTGFNIGSYVQINDTGATFASWTFRKQPKFFDVVTYTGDGTNLYGGSGKVLNHSLGSTPGCIIVKNITTGTTDWSVYHRSLTNPANYLLYLNKTDAQLNAGVTGWATTSTTFTVSQGFGANNNGDQYVAYLFAHDAGGFGLTGTDNVISCGSFVNAGSDVSTTLGYEPQWLMVKNATVAGGNWTIWDNMRGMPVGSADARLYANLSNAETTSDQVEPTATGFTIKGAALGNGTYIYIAIRRGPMKVPTDGTKVFSPVARTGNDTETQVTGVGFSPDMWMVRGRNAAGFAFPWFDRLRGVTKRLDCSSTYLEETFSGSNGLVSIDMDGITIGSGATDGGICNDTGYNYGNWFLKRAPSFFDEVCYTGTGANTTISHNLGVAPELIIVKCRNAAYDWTVYDKDIGNTKTLNLNTTGAAFVWATWNDTTPTSSVFSLGNKIDTNQSTYTYVAYLFATCAGVSKVGSYTGTGTTKQIDCGFAAGARFVLIKRTDSTGDWYVWDTARGIVSGNDPYLLLNSTAAEATTTDYIDAYSAGFELSSTAPAALNASGGTYIFLAIA
jgi:hypothetical protein